MLIETGNIRIKVKYKKNYVPKTSGTYEIKGDEIFLFFSE
jgi:hypothetical protein